MKKPEILVIITKTGSFIAAGISLKQHPLSVRLSHRIGAKDKVEPYIQIKMGRPVSSIDTSIDQVQQLQMMLNAALFLNKQFTSVPDPNDEFILATVQKAFAGLTVKVHRGENL
jgi:hypothetical protein